VVPPHPPSSFVEKGLRCSYATRCLFFNHDGPPRVRGKEIARLRRMMLRPSPHRESPSPAVFMMGFLSRRPLDRVISSFGTPPPPFFFPFFLMVCPSYENVPTELIRFRNFALVGKLPAALPSWVLATPSPLGAWKLLCTAPIIQSVQKVISSE